MPRDRGPFARLHRYARRAIMPAILHDNNTAQQPSQARERFNAYLAGAGQYWATGATDPRETAVGANPGRGSPRCCPTRPGPAGAREGRHGAKPFPQAGLGSGTKEALGRVGVLAGALVHVAPSGRRSAAASVPRSVARTSGLLRGHPASTSSRAARRRRSSVSESCATPMITHNGEHSRTAAKSAALLHALLRREHRLGVLSHVPPLGGTPSPALNAANWEQAWVQSPSRRSHRLTSCAKRFLSVSVRKHEWVPRRCPASVPIPWTEDLGPFRQHRAKVESWPSRCRRASELARPPAMDPRRCRPRSA